MHQAIETEDDEISLLDVLQVVVDNLRLLVLGPLAAGLLALGYTFTISPTFTATANFMAPQKQQSDAGSLLAGLAGAAGIKSSASQYVAFLKSRSVQDALIDRFKLMERFETKYREVARNEISSNVEVVNRKDGLITIAASDKDPEFAALLANAHIEELGKLLNRLAITEAQQRRVFFENQLINAKDNLTRSEQALKSSGVSGSVLKTSPGTAMEGLVNLKAAITAQEIKLASMRGYLNESAPDFKQAQTELFAMRSQMAQVEKADPPSSGGNDSDYISKFREFKYHETLFELYVKQYEMARIDEGREDALVQVIDTALPPEVKTKPKKAQIAAMSSLAIGFVLLLFVFIHKSILSASQTTETAEKFSRLRAAWKKALGRAPSLHV